MDRVLQRRIHHPQRLQGISRMVPPRHWKVWLRYD
ncbi:hypothetical protein CMUS01_15993 [Colletotrichum musicola]|uniref:Uncharacterized protein n=1 Tax=Colletotrichum musicola TaxID=2175873 RepID=A0A8H6ISP4_9PEZI|nr:hypothetical protein CMUS01_15993 [Colletotrichum musicola]